MPSYLVEFDVANDSFKFGAIGLYNTPRDQCFYKIKAKFCNQEWNFNDPEWAHTTTTIYRFKEDTKDIVCTPGLMQPANFQSIIYEVYRYDPTKLKTEWFGFAVQPVLMRKGENRYLCTGQTQLPLYEGNVPIQLLEGRQHPVKVIKSL